ncbi:hypothetical protein M5689_021371 [Euphorbia peplus]|nr:hypothetical protein M5689_021371 [Euphorbia peplus]
MLNLPLMLINAMKKATLKEHVVAPPLHSSRKRKVADQVNTELAVEVQGRKPQKEKKKVEVNVAEREGDDSS